MLISPDEERREFLTWVGPIQDHERFESCRACRTPGTCSWILEQKMVIDWASPVFQDSSSKLLWLYGSAGFGKSVICAAIIEHLQQNEASRLAHHFAAYGPDSQQDVTTVLRSWIAQMITADDRLLDVALEELRQAPLEAGKVTLWKLFTTMVRDSTQWIFVLDGLDEFQALQDPLYQDSRGDQVKFMADILVAVTGTRSRVLVVSRDEPDIRLCLSTTAVHADGLVLYEHQISIADVGVDILAFSRSVVASKLANKSEDIRAEIAEKMALKCEGMFLWIDLHRRDLRAGKNKRQLQQTIENMPAGLNAIYERNWNDITQLAESDKSRALDILRWVTFAVRPLTVAELTEALLVSDVDGAGDLQLDDFPDCIDDEYIASEISGLCGSLLEVSATDPDQPPELQTIYLRHFTVRQFLLTKNLGTELSDTGVDALSSAQTENNYLAIICLRYLMDDNVQEDLRLQGDKRRFTDYAAQFWHQHVSRLGTRYRALSQIATDFFAHALPEWRLWRSRHNHLWCLEFAEEEVDDQELPSPMYYAAYFGLEETIECLHTEEPDSINAIGGPHGTPIKAAYAAGHSQITMRLAELGAELDISAGCHGSLLGCACHRGDLQLCKFLLAKNVSLLASDSMNRTPLYTACREGHTNVLKLLFEHGADISTQDKYGYTPINVASAIGYVEVVKQLLEYGADLSVANVNGYTPLYWACLDGHLEVTRLFLKHGADLSTTNNDGWSPINAASANGHIEVVKLLLGHNADLTIATTEGQSPLYFACLGGHLEVVKILLENGADLSIPNNNGYAPISVALAHGHLKVVELLLEHNADACALMVSKSGLTPFYTAAKYGYVDVLKLLLEHGADLSRPAGAGWTPVTAASDSGHTDVVEFLLKHKADASVSTETGYTPVHAAAIKGYHEILELLLEHQVDLSIADHEGWTPINMASNKGYSKIVKLLLENGADASVPTKDGWTSIHSASRGGYFDIVQLLVKYEVDIEIANVNGWTPIFIASNMRHTEIVELLLEHGAKATVVTESGLTPIEVAAWGGHINIVNILLEHGAEVPTIDADGEIPLHEASAEGHTRIVQILLEHNASVSIVNKYGSTPLYLAAYNGHVDVTKLLLEHETDFSIVNKMGWTPLHAAVEGGHMEIAKYLLDKGFNPRSCTKLLETSLHLASARDRLEMVDLLMAKGCDAELMDGFGRTCLDWLALCPRFVTARKWTSQHTPTSEAASRPVLQKTINQLVDSVLAKKTTDYSYDLGRCLLFIGDESNSRFAFQQAKGVYCNRCDSDEDMPRNRYVCRSCVDTDLCEEYFQVFREDEEPWRCQSHEFLHLTYDESETQKLPESDWLEWLSKIREQYAVKESVSTYDGVSNSQEPPLETQSVQSTQLTA